MRKLISGVMLALLVASMLVSTSTVKTSKADTNPTFISCDAAGNEKLTFALGENVYGRGSIFMPNREVSIYIIPTLEDPTPSNAMAPPVHATTDASGHIPLTLIWTANTIGKYDIWVDTNQNGMFDEGVDGYYYFVYGYLFDVVPESSAGDLELVDFSPVQVVYEASALVANKPTVFRAVVQNSFVKPHPLRIRFTYNGGSPTDYLTTIAANSVKEVFIPFGSYILPQEGTITYSAEIDPGNRIQESNENNNLKSGSSKVKETRGMKVLYIPVAWVGEQTVTPEQIRLDASQASDFIEATYPVGIDDYSDVVKTNPHHFYKQPILTLCIAIQIQAWLSGQDKGVGIVPDNWLDTNVGPGTSGYCYTGIGGVLVETDYWTTVAHELGHECGLWSGPNGGPDDEEYRHSNNVPGVGIGRPASGYWVTLNRQIGKTYGATTETAICFMGSSDFSQHTLFNRWICREDYEKLLNTFKITPDPQILLVSGVIFDNDTAEIGDWFRLPEGEADLTPGNVGEFILRLLDSQDAILNEFGFNSSEARNTSEISNFTGFAYRIPYDEQTRRIWLLRGSNVITERIVSPNPPTVDLTFPNGGERLAPGNNCTITWSASDPDEGNLTYTVLHSSDGGTNWIPLAYGLTDNSYSWDTSFSEPSAYNLIKVVATDGVNTCADISEGNFTILDVDPPSIGVISPESRTYYSDMVPLTFQIGESASWIGYSLDAGSNSTIGGNTTIQVGEGQHHIRLYANDSSGNMGFSETTCFFVNSSTYSPWESSFTSLDGYPVTSLAVHDGRLYAVANNKLYSYDNTSLSVVAAPTYLTSLESYSGRLVVGGQDGLYYLDNATLKLAFPVPTYIKTLGVYNNVLYAGTFLDNPPTLYYCNGSVDNPSDWGIDTGFWNILNFAGPFGSIDSFAAYSGKMYVASGNTVYCFDGTGWSVALSYDYAYAFLDMQTYNGKLYLATRDLNRIPLYVGGTGFSGVIIELDGENWTTVLGHDYWIYSLEEYDGKLYVGTANRIYTFNGTFCDISFYSEEGAYYAISMTTYDGKIYAGMGNGYIFADPAPTTANPDTIVVPEFPSTTILAVFMALTILAVALTKKNRSRRFS